MSATIALFSCSQRLGHRSGSLGQPQNQAESGSPSRFQYKSMLSLAKRLRSIFSSCAGEEEVLCLSTIGSVGLAHAGVIPEGVANSPMQRLIDQYCRAAGLPPPVVDRTPFAVAGTAIFQKAYEPAEKLAPATLDAVVRLLLSDAHILRLQAQQAAGEPGSACYAHGQRPESLAAAHSLDVAWMKQCLTKLRQQQPSGNGSSLIYIHKGGLAMPICLN